jgi:hypothetical protein
MILHRCCHPALVLLLPVALLAVAIGSCRSAEEPGEPLELRFIDYVGPQQRQVSTDFVLPDRERDGDRLGFGWAVKQPKGSDETVMEMKRESARIRFFSAAGDARSLEIEAHWSGGISRLATTGRAIAQRSLKGRYGRASTSWSSIGKPQIPPRRGRKNSLVSFVFDISVSTPPKTGHFGRRDRPRSPCSTGLEVDQASRSFRCPPTATWTS